jgi:23S rRNA pseudouridine1911/1915/1917 synthase
LSERLFVVEGSGNERLDRLMAAQWSDISRSRLQALVRSGCVTLDGAAIVDPSRKVGPGTAVRLVEPPPVPAEPEGEDIRLDIMFEDDEVVVLDKPAGLVVHPAAGHETGTLVNALIRHCGDSLSGIGGVRRPGIVHRLDKDTTGLLVVAKTDRAHQSLAAEFADHGRTGPLERAYLAFVWGVPEPRVGEVATDIARSRQSRERMAVVAEGQGRRSITRYAVEDTFTQPGIGGEDNAGVASLVRCHLETGRTHQIRVHLAHLRHPLLGDALYGAGFKTKTSLLGQPAQDALTALRRQALHATLLQFSHPVTRRILRFESALPHDLARLREALAL